MKKRWLAFVLFGVVLFGTASFVIGQGSNEGTVIIEILPNIFDIIIHHPENTTYEFDRGVPYILDLNVSANAPVLTWEYVLFEPERQRAGGVVLGGNEIENVGFAPNISFNAVRWSNVLNVSAVSVGALEDKDNVTFYVHVNNSAPQIEELPAEIFVCEGTSYSPSFLSFSISANDTDEMDLDFGIQPDFNLFFLANKMQSISPDFTLADSEVFSSNLFNESGFYEVDILIGEDEDEEPLVSTGEMALADSRRVNITVIEINSEPNITNPVGVQTIWNVGDNSTFYHDFDAVDDESGDEITGALAFNISFEPGPGLFGINGSGGVDFDATGLATGVYNVSICVTDEGLLAPHPQILAECGQDGLNETACNDFELTITNQNRPPQIVNFTPDNLTISAAGEAATLFNITEHDPDGTTPDAYWYVDSVFVEYDAGSLVDELSFAFACGVSGLHFVKAEITDGELNASLIWNVTVEGVSCSGPPPGGGGGGGGGGGFICEPQWACDNWRFCSDVESGLEIGRLSGETYRDVQAECLSNGWGDEFCGYQARGCTDVKQCGSSAGKPEEVQVCYFTENPTCFDGIKNCHDGDCEFLVDCGGSCGACATCSDGIQNQGEGAVDCGGPCPNACPAEFPLRRGVSLYLWIGLAILILIVLYFVYRVLKKRKAVESVKKPAAGMVSKKIKGAIGR